MRFHEHVYIDVCTYTSVCLCVTRTPAARLCRTRLVLLTEEASHSVESQKKRVPPSLSSNQAEAPDVFPPRVTSHHPSSFHHNTTNALEHLLAVGSATRFSVDRKAQNLRRAQNLGRNIEHLDYPPPQCYYYFTSWDDAAGVPRRTATRALRSAIPRPGGGSSAANTLHRACTTSSARSACGKAARCRRPTGTRRIGSGGEGQRFGALFFTYITAAGRCRWGRRRPAAAVAMGCVC